MEKSVFENDYEIVKAFESARVQKAFIPYSVGNPVRIADVAIYESGEKTHEFIPCRRKSDGVLGLYDTVAKQFLPNSGSAEGDFIAGPELEEADSNGLVIFVR